MQLRFLAFAAGLAVASTASGDTGLPQMMIRVEGQAHAPGEYAVVAGGRLSQAMVAARPKFEAYGPGVAFLRESERVRQVRLRAGLEHDLTILQKSKDSSIANAATDLSLWLDAHDATGRIPLAVNDMRLMQVQPKSDPTLESGDVLIIPSRPNTIKVMGAVAATCELDHEPLRDARDYLSDCPTNAGADPNDLYVIQPDAHILRLGIAMWNRADPQSVAPGGVIFVPIRQRAVDTVDATFNAEFAAFVATQVLRP